MHPQLAISDNGRDLDFPRSEVREDLRRFARLLASGDELESLRLSMPQLSERALLSLTRKIACFEPLGFSERLDIALTRLSESPLPRDGEEAFQQIAAAFLALEKDYLLQSLPAELAAEAKELAGSHDISSVVDAAFAAYQFEDPASHYDEKSFPAVYRRMLKPPARRYARGEIFTGKEVIPQLSHLTIIDIESGAVQIQKIDAAYAGARIANPPAPLLSGISGDKEYFKNLPARSDLVIFDRPGLTGARLWDSCEWRDENWGKPSATSRTA
jgi:hypothetical protein